MLTGPRRFELATVPCAEPGPGQVRVEVSGCGVCGSDLPVWEGRPWFSYPRPPGTPGHEGWGDVDAIGDGVTHVEVGRPVAFLSTQAYSRFVIAEADEAVPVPHASAGRPFPGEALGCAFNVVARSDITAGDTVAVVGVGFLGAAVAGIAAARGARVIAIGRRPYALEQASIMGAAHVVGGEDPAHLLGKVSELTSGSWCDVVVEATGRQAPLDLAGELVRERGRLVVAGFHQDGRRSVDMQLWNWRGIDVVNAHERDPAVVIAGMRAAASAIDAGWFDPSPLYTHTFPLDRLGDSLELGRTRPDGFMKALVTL